MIKNMRMCGLKYVVVYTQTEVSSRLGVMLLLMRPCGHEL